MPDVDVTDAREVTLAVGDRATVRLPENPTTGYVWSVGEHGPGVAVEDEFRRPAAAGVPGAGGEYAVRITAREPGSWVVRLRLARAWEGEALEERDVTITVT